MKRCQEKPAILWDNDHEVPQVPPRGEKWPNNEPPTKPTLPPATLPMHLAGWVNTQTTSLLQEKKVARKQVQHRDLRICNTFHGSRSMIFRREGTTNPLKRQGSIIFNYSIGHDRSWSISSLVSSIILYLNSHDFPSPFQGFFWYSEAQSKSTPQGGANGHRQAKSQDLTVLGRRKKYEKNPSKNRGNFGKKTDGKLVALLLKKDCEAKRLVILEFDSQKKNTANTFRRNYF